MKRKWPLILVRRGSNSERCSPAPGEWWHELPDNSTADSFRRIGYEVAEVVPVSQLVEAVADAYMNGRSDAFSDIGLAE